MSASVSSSRLLIVLLHLQFFKAYAFKAVPQLSKPSQAQLLSKSQVQNFSRNIDGTLSLSVHSSFPLYNSRQNDDVKSYNGDNRIGKERHRRHFLQNLFKATSTSMLSLFSIPLASRAAQLYQEKPAAESIRRAASKIPGYGQADNYYPPFYQGKWRVQRDILVSSDEEYDDQLFKGLLLPMSISYDVRFIEVDGGGSINEQQKDGGSAGLVVADRQFNEISYYNALRTVADAKPSRPTLPMLQSATWSPSNPNVLQLSFDDQSSREVRVTKRATEIIDVDGGIVSSSEFRRVVTISAVEGGRGGIPSVAASRVLTKWRKGTADNGDDVLEAIEVVYSEGGVLGDPMGGNGSMGGGMGKPNGPRLTLKSRLRLVRQN